MQVTVEVLVSGPVRPPSGVPVVVQVRDTGLQDAAATVLGEARGVVGTQGATLATLEVLVNTSCASPTVWAHIDTDGDGRVSKGDYVTTRSYPLPRDTNPRLPVTVIRV